jgi:hypothetical protein
MSLLPEVREELMATAARRAQSPRRRARFAGRGGLTLALGVGVALAVVAIGLVALRHRPAAPAGSDGSTLGSGVAALEAKLAVLRRPQTGAEAAYARRFPPRGAVIGKLVRLTAKVPTATGAVRVYVLVVRRSRTGVGAVATAVDRHGQTQGGQVVASTLTPSAVGAGAMIRGLGRDPNRGVAVGVVPDGVARVKWVFTGAGFGILDPRPLTVYPPVKNNIAVAPVIPNQGPLARATWYGADGQVIASASGGQVAKSELRQIQAVNASRDRPIASELIAHYRLFRSVAPVDLAKSPVLPTARGGAGDLNYWQTRYIGSLSGLDGRGLWITPGTHDVCISDWNAGECGPLSHRDEAGIFGGTTSGGGETTLTGLVPDGNPTVTVVLAGGRERLAHVIDNAYEITVPGRPRAIISRDIHGKVVRTPLGG